MDLFLDMPPGADPAAASAQVNANLQRQLAPVEFPIISEITLQVIRPELELAAETVELIAATMRDRVFPPRELILVLPARALWRALDANDTLRAAVGKLSLYMRESLPFAEETSAWPGVRWLKLHSFDALQNRVQDLLAKLPNLRRVDVYRSQFADGGNAEAIVSVIPPHLQLGLYYFARAVQGERRFEPPPRMRSKSLLIALGHGEDIALSTLHDCGVERLCIRGGVVHFTRENAPPDLRELRLSHCDFARDELLDFVQHIPLRVLQLPHIPFTELADAQQWFTVFFRNLLATHHASLRHLIMHLDILDVALAEEVVAAMRNHMRLAQLTFFIQVSEPLVTVLARPENARFVHGIIGAKLEVRERQRDAAVEVLLGS